MSENWSENEGLRKIYVKPESSTGVSGICATLLISAGFLVALVALCRADECKPVAEYQATHEGTLLVEKRGVNFAGVVSNYLASIGQTDVRLFAFDYLLVPVGKETAVVPVRDGIICEGWSTKLSAPSSEKLLYLLQRHDWRTRV